jgi:hypothetical protein
MVTVMMMAVFHHSVTVTVTVTVTDHDGYDPRHDRVRAVTSSYLLRYLPSGEGHFVRAYGWNYRSTTLPAKFRSGLVSAAIILGRQMGRITMGSEEMFYESLPGVVADDDVEDFLMRWLAGEELGASCYS